MKKIQIITAFLIASVLFVGCGKEELAQDIAISNDKIEVLKYKGLKIEKCELEEISEESINENIQYMVDLSSERISITDRSVEAGDTVVLNINCEIDGVPYEHLCYESTELLVPRPEEVDVESDDILNFIAMQTIGSAAGKIVSYDFAMPNYYSVFPEIAGKTAHWDVEIKEVVRVTAAEFNDAFVLNQDIDGITTTDEYREYIREQMQDYAENNLKYTLQDEVLQALMKQTNLLVYPQKEIDEYVEEYISSYKENAQMLNISYEEYVQEYIGSSVKEFENQILEMAEQYVKEDLVLSAIADKEGLVVTDAVYAEEADEYARQYGYDNASAMESSFGRNSVIASMERERVLNFLVEQAVQTDNEFSNELEGVKEESNHITRLLYVTVGLAVALLITLIVLVLVLIKNKHSRE